MDKKTFTVSQLTELIGAKLESEFAWVAVEGEISNYKPYPSGHIYFTLKDEGAVISAVIFKYSARKLDFKPKDGTKVIATGQVQVYAPRGNYQLVVDKMEELDGTGDILAMLEKRKKKLAAEGLFDEERKKAIPRFPAAVGVITSPKGAAIRDILQVLSRRAPGLRVIVLPALVQGDGAAEMIARRVEQANQWALADVLIVGRGGGAMEDLLPFSEECVVRAIAASEIPVISAVGHEIDWALSDFAADLRAPTPSAAAELVCENHLETLSALSYWTKNLHQFMQSRLERVKLMLKPFSAENLEQQFRFILQPRLMRFDGAREVLFEGMREITDDIRQKLTVLKTALESASPKSILERGFSVVINSASGKVVRRSSEARPGELLTIRPLEGVINAQVTERAS